MGTFIANLLKYNKIEDRIYLRGGSSNVVPRCNKFVHYDSKSDLLRDLISGCLELRCKNSISIKALNALENIKSKHKDIFGERQLAFGGSLSINVYSLYQFSRYIEIDKKSLIKGLNENDMLFNDSFKAERLLEANTIELIYEEAILFYKKSQEYFLNYLGVN